ncbi:hypothetical protein [Roseibium album]
MNLFLVNANYPAALAKVNYVAKVLIKGCECVVDNFVVRGLRKFCGQDVQYFPPTTPALRQESASICSIYRDLPEMEKSALEVKKNAEKNAFFQKYRRIAADRGMTLNSEDSKHIEEAYLASKIDLTDGCLSKQTSDGDESSYSCVYTYSS